MALSRMEIRLLALETLMAFQFAGRHMQTSNPAAAVEQLRGFLVIVAQGTLYTGLSAADIAAVSAELEVVVDRILLLQERLPARLVD